MKKQIVSILFSICLVLMIVPISVNAMYIHVNLNVTGATELTLEVESGDWIETVKGKIKDQTGYSETNQVLKYNGRILQNGTVLADYSIGKESTIELFLAPSVTAFATKDQLMNDFIPIYGRSNIGKLVFGKNSKGQTQEWFILGKDKGVVGDNTIIFAVDAFAERLAYLKDPIDKREYKPEWECTYPSGVNVQYVYSNHYGGSDLRQTLKSMAENLDYFTQAEQNLMNETTVKSVDQMKYMVNGQETTCTFTTNDKLYAPSILPPEPLFFNDSRFLVGSNNETCVFTNYWGNSGSFWSRKIDYLHDVNENNVTMCTANFHNKSVSYAFVNLLYNISPAGNLDLSSVLFASAAEASSDGIETGTIASDKAMTLRLDGTGKSIGTAKYNDIEGVIVAKKDPNASHPVSLVVQGTDGVRDWYYSMKLEGTSENYVSKPMLKVASGLSDLSLEDCKIWLETTDSDARMTYAVMATQETPQNLKGLQIGSVSLTGVIPTPDQTFPSTCQMELPISTRDITYTTNENGVDVPVTGTVEWNKTYKATVEIGTFLYHTSVCYFSSSVYVKIDGEALPDYLSPGANGVLTITKEFTTEKRKSITGIVSPLIPAGNTFTTYYGYDGYMALPTNGSELGKQVTVAVLDKKDSTTQNEMMNVTWSVANANGTNYDKTPGATNTFQWTIPASALATYDATNCPGYDASSGTITGTVSITNKAAIPVTISGRDSAIEYAGTDIEVSQYFDIDSNAGTPTYSLIADAEGGTGEGTLNGSKLSVTKTGLFKIKLSTAANGIYAAKEKTITLTVEKGTMNYSVSDYRGTYDGNPHSISVNVSAPSNTVVTYSTDEIHYGIDNPSFTDAGTYTVHYRIETNNYNTVVGSKTVIITKKPIIITANPQSIMWGNQLNPGAYSVSENGIVTGDRMAAITLTPSTEDRTDDGTISISGVKIENAEGSDVTGNYDITLVNGSLAIIHNTSLAPERIDAVKTKTYYMVGETLNMDDITVTAYYADGYSEDVTNYTTNASDMDMLKAETKTLIVSYSKNNGTKTTDITITVNDEHIDKNKDHKCDICGAIVSEHTGGEATCTSKAICEVCGNEYGKIDSNNHDLKKVPEKSATVTETGNKAYWHCMYCDKYFSDAGGKTEIADIHEWKIGDGRLDKLAPEIIEGTKQSITVGEMKDLIFRSNAAFSDFIRVEIDGATLDEKNYTAKEGSTIVTIKADYIANLSTGKHTIGIVSTSGTATTRFTINRKTAANNDVNSPHTGDNSHMLLWITLLFVSGGLLTLTICNIRNTKWKRRKSNE